jgi:pimeloyl-ACP methyl ester carboxylesterase
MIRFPGRSDFENSARFSPDDVLQGVQPAPGARLQAGLLRVQVDGTSEDIRFYGRKGEPNLAPLVYLSSDCLQKLDGVLSVFPSYGEASPLTVQDWAEQVSVSLDRTFLALARPGIYGSSGDHKERRRPREVAIVGAALDALKAAFGWKVIDLVGLSGGGHLVAALLAERDDIGCAVIASGNVSVRHRNADQGWQTDITGFSDFVDPIDLVARVAKSPPRQVIVLTARKTKLSRPRANRHTWALSGKPGFPLTIGLCGHWSLRATFSARQRCSLLPQIHRVQ